MFNFITSIPVPFSLRRRAARDEVHGKFPGVCPGVRAQGLPWGSYQLIAHDLKKAFEEVVDDYITFCEEKGVKPNKPFKGSFNVRLKPLIHKLAYQKAMQKGMSLNKFIETSLEKELNE